MPEFDVKDIKDEEFLTPAVRRYLDRLLDLNPSYAREIKIKRIKGEKDIIEIVVLVKDNNNSVTVTIYQMRYHARESLEATLNSPALVKVIDIYDETQAKEVWENV